MENKTNTIEKVDVTLKDIVKESEGKVKKPSRIKPHHKKIAAWMVILIVVFSLLIIVAGAIYAHQSIYENKVYPGVVVWGEPVGGKTVNEVQQLITDKVKNYKVTLASPDQTYEPTADELGLVFNIETMALSAYSKGRTGSFTNNIVTRTRLLGMNIEWNPAKNFFRAKELEISPSFTFYETKLDNYIAKISENLTIKEKDSEVKVNGGSIEIVPAVYGRQVETEDLSKDLKGAVKRLQSKMIEIKTISVKPKIVDTAADKVVSEAQEITNRPVALTYLAETYKPDKETITSWVVFVKEESSENYKLVVDPAKMKNYFSFLSSKIYAAPVHKKVKVENGGAQTVTQEGKDGIALDEGLLGRQIADALPKSEAINIAIPTYAIKYKTEYENVLVADWAKYIEINISTQTMTAYEQGGKIVGQWKVTTGASYTPTPVGTWLIHGKTAVTRMTGGTPGIDYYDLPNVHWVSWFKGGGYSIHEAYWRTSFGGMDYTWNGSHGCVNSPIDVAKFIYDWAPVGTPVVVHY
ncbi:TPA: hypothetical protein DDW69_04150 [candidate division CPR2 bacterium]|uniref:ErfK/YbiS/YcfS/YnhG n=1 Tax=candidate division CPR2 bacterium GW2011_GWC1_41_48 TaxID=1618344 RepID=A0A0G0W8D1_UNCC2|nr:MAG: ErfK/YbiS/YcfS/YnhG [candidate division CPR2 bacterium GW2011_GWC2_39_35]KKR27282.1 MAG: ErfK/YbiS/YcfS/YnhG [candidate division CPR2 bacterium GW2011_GWD2_39_7]KKS09244.1 MAG: ErfK/YbiS/YcfS/YnhG [candidate division CPR2 bacterium GW2011_GWC1_41_48]HBG81999.1 hypothetical protein [candidate division CPR2 bacterium]